MLARRPSRSPRLALASAALALVLIAGCSGGPPGVSSSEEEATVSGTVRLGGKPVAQGQVTFDPSSSVRRSASARSAPIGKDGTYSITTLIGQNRVRFAGISAQRNVSFDEVAHQVPSGTSTFDIDLKETQPRRGR